MGLTTTEASLASAEGAAPRGQDPLTVLGTDIFLHVLEFLSPRQLVQLETVSNKWHSFLVDDQVWGKVCRRENVDLKEWNHVVGEELAYDADEPYIPPDVSYSDLEHHRKLDTARDYRSAYSAHLMLQCAWDKILGYESLLPTPAFRLRNIYMDHDEATLYALTESSASSTEEHLLVLHRYTGSLLLRLPAIAGAYIVVGSGYIAVAECARPQDDDFDAAGGRDPLGRVTVYRTANAATRAARLPDGVRKEWKRTGLPLGYYQTIHTMCECLVMSLGTVHGEGVLIAANDTTVHLCYLDTNHTATFSYDIRSALKTSNVDGTEGWSSIRAVDVRDELVFVVLSSAVLVFNLQGERLVSFPEAGADPYYVGEACFHAVAERWSEDIDSPYALPGLQVAQTMRWEMRCTRPYHYGEPNPDYEEEVRLGFLSPDDRGVSYLDFKQLVFTQKHLAVRSRGAILVVPNYRRVLAGAAKLVEEKRARLISVQSAFIVNRNFVDDMATNPYSDRLAMHPARACLVVFDLATLPDLPLRRDFDCTTNPSSECDGGMQAYVPVQRGLSAFSFEVSCLENISELSSIAMDSRGVYMCDWDKGWPSRDVDYEDLHDLEANVDAWDWNIRANFGHLKIWSFRPRASLLRRDNVGEWQTQTVQFLGAPRQRALGLEAEMNAQSQEDNTVDYSLGPIGWLATPEPDEYDSEEDKGGTDLDDNNGEGDGFE